MTLVAVCAAGGSSGSTTTSLLLAALSRASTAVVGVRSRLAATWPGGPVAGVAGVDVGGG